MLFSAASAAALPAGESAGTGARAAHLAAIAASCLPCHGHDKRKGGIELEGRRGPHLAGEEKVWRQAAQALTSGEMPPAGKPQPTPAQRQTLVGWIENEIADLERRGRDDPGAVPLRRLTNAEYERTVRALTGLDLGLAAGLPADGAAGEGFTNASAALSVTATHLEEYLAAARTIAGHLEPRYDGTLGFVPRRLDGEGAAQAWAMERVTAFYARRPAAAPAPALAPAGKDAKKPDTTKPAAAKGPAVRLTPPKATPGQGIPRYIPFHRDDADVVAGLDAAGRAELDALWAQLRWAARLPEQVDAGWRFNYRAILGGVAASQALQGDAVIAALRRGYDDVQSKRFALAGFDRLGTLEATIADWTRISAELAAFRAEQPAIEARHVAALAGLAARAWRRPLVAGEAEALAASYRRLRGEGGADHLTALRLALARILAAPDFVYRVEQPRPGAAAQPVSAHELASRLSYTLWAGPPDDALLAAAADGSLLTDAGVRAQATRMLADARVEGLAAEFLGQWLRFAGFDHHSGPDPARFPEFTPELRRAMYEEPLRFGTDLLRADRPLTELLDADRTVVDAALARHYGMPAPAGGGWQVIENASRFGRGGLAGMAAFLTRGSGPLRTSPVKRGAWLVSDVLGLHIGEPPADVPDLPDDEKQADRLTLRQRVERHRSDAACAGCHARIDPPGFALEGYDAIGRRRTADAAGSAIDDRAESDGKAFSGLAGLRGWLRTRAGAFQDTACAKLAGYALGRALAPGDRALVARMRAALERAGGRPSAAMLELVTSKPFRERRGRDAPAEE